MFLFLLVFFLAGLSLIVNNFIIWWGVFLIMTLLFVMINKMTLSYSSLFNYFIMQEVLGLMFLLLSVSLLQLLVVLIKVGVAPLHFWIFSVLNNVYGFNLMWFLTFQKLPFLVIMIQLMEFYVLILFVVGLMMCLVQMLLLKSYKSLLILSSTESFNWIILGFLMSMFSVFLIFMYYFFLMLYLVPKFENENFYSYVSWETMLIFMNMPFSVNFFVKIFALGESLVLMDFWFLLVLFLMFLSVLSLGFWMVNLSVKNFFTNKYNKFGFFMFLPMMFLVLL
uniref:NADH dehydrogenase subunit 2 n=1 Tax=Nippostrongylus brasiliensis TaxID=27835 RepID=A0A3G1GMD7_NIPBR|nr:NADH dehydrogenase subunit 2 [Nippostrongylus brasiliensis]APU89583.1 NADH dehydrogenase subunit 2 [Nippostrongylus brasiliensis]